jgi:hypothetical protein
MVKVLLSGPRAAANAVVAGYRHTCAFFFIELSVGSLLFCLSLQRRLLSSVVGLSELLLVLVLFVMRHTKDPLHLIQSA